MDKNKKMLNGMYADSLEMLDLFILGRLERDPKDIIKYIEDKIKELEAGGYTNIKVRCDDDPYEPPSYYFVGDRIESDAEYKCRIADEKKKVSQKKKEAKEQEERERATLAKLLRKYGKGKKE